MKWKYDIFFALFKLSRSGATSGSCCPRWELATAEGTSFANRRFTKCLYYTVHPTSRHKNIIQISAINKQENKLHTFKNLVKRYKFLKQACNIEVAQSCHAVVTSKEGNSKGTLNIIKRQIVRLFRTICRADYSLCVFKNFRKR